MTKRKEPFFGWPGWEHLQFCGLLAVAQTLWFALIYIGCDRLTAIRSTRVQIHFDAELRMPFVPEMVVFYMSIYPLFWAAPFILRRRRQIRALVITLAVVTLCGGIGFLLLPAEPAFPSPCEPGRWSRLFYLADALNLEYNMVPSLHVALSVVCVAAYSGQTGKIGSAFLWAWAAAIIASTLLTHQHHLLDVATGLILGQLAAKFVYGRLCPIDVEASLANAKPAKDAVKNVVGIDRSDDFAEFG